MSDREQLNEMKQFMSIAEGGERPYLCHHPKKEAHGCYADSSYGAAKKAAEHWGLNSTADISATPTDITHSTQFIGEDEGHSIRDILNSAELADLLGDLDKQGDIVYGASYFDKLYFHFLDTHPDEIPVGSRTGRPDDVDGYVLDNLERDYGDEVKSMIDRDLTNRKHGVVEDEEFIDDKLRSGEIDTDDVDWDEELGESPMDPDVCRDCFKTPCVCSEDDWDEDTEDDEHYNMKDAEAEEFEGRTVFITDLYDGDVYGMLDGNRFMISSPIDRGYGVHNVTDDEIEIHDADYALTPDDEDFLRRFHLGDDEEGEWVDEARGDVPMSQVPDRVKKAMKDNDWKPCEYCKNWEDGFDPRPATYGNMCPKCDSAPPPTMWMRGESISEDELGSWGNCRRCEGHGTHLGIECWKCEGTGNEELSEDTNDESKATQDVTAIIDAFFDGLLVLKKRSPFKSKKHPSTLGFRFDLRKGAYNEFREFTLALRRQKIKKADIANVLERQIREAGYTFYNPFPKRNPVKVQASHGGLGSDYPHVGFVLDFEGDSIYKRGSMDQDGNVDKVMKELDEGANDNWGVGDVVVAAVRGRYGEPLKVTGVYGDQVRVVDDYGNSELMFPEDLRLAPNEVSETGWDNVVASDDDEEDDNREIKDRHAERPHTPGYNKLGSGARAAADSRAQAFMFDEDSDPDGMGSYDIIWNDETWKEAIPYNIAQKEVDRILNIIDDSALQAHDNNDHLKTRKEAEGDTMTWTVHDHIDGDHQVIRVEPSDMPAGYTGESIVLDSIVESVLEEYPGQPKDYAVSDSEVEVEDEFEQDRIDPEIEDEELGLRFD